MSRKSFSLIACLVFVFSFVATPFPALAEEIGTISGVVFSEDGDPIAGLWVDACEYDTGENCASAETDRDGQYSIDLLPGEYWVQVWVDRDWIGQAYDVDPQDGIPDRVGVGAGQDTSGINFELLKAGNITGRVTDEFGNPIPDLWVDACEYNAQSFCASAPTDENGYYIIPVQPGDYYWVQVWVDRDWIGQRYPNPVLPALAEEEPTQIDFTLLAAGNITGRVVDEFGTPIQEIWVDACEYETQSFCASAQTDENGYYIIPLLPGYYRVQVWTEGYIGEFYKDDAMQEDAKRVKVKLGKDTHKIDFSLEIE